MDKPIAFPSTLFSIGSFSRRTLIEELISMLSIIKIQKRKTTLKKKRALAVNVVHLLKEKKCNNECKY